MSLIIAPNEHPDNLSLEDIDKRLDLLLDYIDYRTDTKITAINKLNDFVHNLTTYGIVFISDDRIKVGSFNQWLCWNRYSSLAI